MRKLPYFLPKSSFSSSKNPFLDTTFSQILSYLDTLKSRKIIDFKTPEQLSKIIDFSIPESRKSSDLELSLLIQKVIDFSVHPGHPHFFNTLFAGGDQYSLAGEFLASALNGTMYSYEMAPVFNLMEAEILKKHAKMLQWETTDGIFCPGGSIANLYGLILARYHRFPEIKKIGLKKLPEMAIFTSELAHYSIEKAALITGLGLENVYKIETDFQGKMMPSALESSIIKAKNEGKVPFFVNATMGTTVFGAIDPIDEIQRICEKFGIWLHVDGSFGGALMFMDEKRDLFKGISKADSAVFDPHKVLSIPLQCSIFLTKHQKLLKSCNSTHAEYLFMNDKMIYDAERLDLGDGAIQCGRHIDVLKYWLYLKAHGCEKVIDQVRNAIENAKYLAEIVKKHENFELIVEPEFLAVNFFYFSDRLKKIRNSMKNEEKSEKNEEFWKEVSRIAPIIKGEMVKRGSMMIAYQRQRQKNRSLNNFFRPIVTVNKTKEDMEFIVEEMHRIGKDL